MENNFFTLITGASSGIGFSLAREFAAHGHDLVIVAHDEKKLAGTASLLSQEHGVQVIAIAKDLTDPAAPLELYNEIHDRNICIDILVNDAGEGQREKFAETDIERDLYILRLNIEALVRLTKLYLAEMVDRGRGRILNLGSVAGFQPGPLLAVYHASKAFVVSLSEALYEELKDSGVTVTVLCPGPTDTDFFKRADMENARILEKGIVMEPDEVAKAGYKALMNGERVVIPGMSNKILTFTRRLIPLSLQTRINRKLYEISQES